MSLRKTESPVAIQKIRKSLVWLSLSPLIFMFSCNTSNGMVEKKIIEKNASFYAKNISEQTGKIITDFITSCPNKHPININIEIIDELKQNFIFKLYCSSDQMGVKHFKLFIYDTVNEPKNLVGCAYFTSTQKPLFTVIRADVLTIAKKFRGTGLGKGLILWLINIAKNIGNDGAILNCSVRPIKVPGETDKDTVPMEKLIEYYKKFGFCSNPKSPEQMTMYIDSTKKILSVDDLRLKIKTER